MSRIKNLSLEKYTEFVKVHTQAFSRWHDYIQRQCKDTIRDWRRAAGSGNGATRMTRNSRHLHELKYFNTGVNNASSANASKYK